MVRSLWYTLVCTATLQAMCIKFVRRTCNIDTCIHDVSHWYARTSTWDRLPACYEWSTFLEWVRRRKSGPHFSALRTRNKNNQLLKQWLYAIIFHTHLSRFIVDACTSYTINSFMFHAHNTCEPLHQKTCALPEPYWPPERRKDIRTRVPAGPRMCERISSRVWPGRTSLESMRYNCVRVRVRVHVGINSWMIHHECLVS